MKRITIGKKEYTFEFTVEAALYDECTERLSGLFLKLGEGQENGDVKAVLSGIANIPQTTLALFYAGLLEHHGDCGDETVLSKSDAKKLLKVYLEEHKEEENGDFYGILEMLMGCMEDDGFFKRTGLTRLFAQAQEQEKVIPKPQDHKKSTKSKKVSEN